MDAWYMYVGLTAVLPSEQSIRPPPMEKIDMVRIDYRLPRQFDYLKKN